MSQHSEKRSIAELVGYNAEGAVVYEETLDIGDYYDSEHVWDNTEGILELGIVRVTGILYEDDGTIMQEFTTCFSAETGLYIGSTAKHADGTIQTDGICD